MKVLRVTTDLWISAYRAKLEKEGIDPVLFGLTDKDFEMLSKNFAKIRNQLMQTNELLDKYKEYYESEEDNNEQK